MATVQLDVERVRDYMAQQGWGERELAKQMGLAYSYVNRLLSGKRQVGPRAIAGLALAGLEWQTVLRIVLDTEAP
jgi:transcriptional regulator with XRE-family HTH domain